MSERVNYPRPYVDHRILTLHGVESHRLNDLPFFVKTFNEMLRNDLGVEVIGEFEVHQFTPSEQGDGDGISGVGIIGASHEAIHSWPEINHLRANFEFCSKQEELRRLDLHLLERFNPSAMESEQNIVNPNGTNLMKYAAYSKTLDRTESGLLVYRGAKSLSVGVSETTRLLHEIQSPHPPQPPIGRRLTHLGLFNLEIKEAA